MQTRNDRAGGGGCQVSASEKPAWDTPAIQRVVPTRRTRGGFAPSNPNGDDAIYSS